MVTSLSALPVSFKPLSSFMGTSLSALPVSFKPLSACSPSYFVTSEDPLPPALELGVDDGLPPLELKAERERRRGSIRGQET